MRDKPSSKRVGGVGLGTKAARATLFVALHSAESRESYNKRSCCWENVIDTARCCHLASYDTRCWRAWLGMCHADLRREAAAVIEAKSLLQYIIIAA